MDATPSLDRLVLDHAACDSQAALNAFWDRVPADMEEALFDRLNELFPADPNECTCTNPYAARIRAIERGMCEVDAAFFTSLMAQGCAKREGRTVACEGCEQYVRDFGPSWVQDE